MKILHSKTAPEPILLVSACPVMNLFAIVTRRAVVVYRSTTLTALVSIALSDVDGVPASNANATTTTASSGSARDDGDAHSLKACWSPSGSIFTLALASGVIVLIDVESGELIRRLIPSRDAAAPVKVHTFRHGSTSGMAPIQPLDLALCAAEDEDHDLRLANEEARGDGPSARSQAETPEGDDDEEILAFHKRCRRPLWRPPSIPLSTTIGEPVCGVAWVRVAIPQDSPGTASPHHSTRCVPLENSIAAPLLPELGGHFGTNVVEGETASLSTSILVVLDARGVVSFVQGGLYEVSHLLLALPPSLHPRDGTLEVCEFSLMEATAQVCGKTKSAAAGKGEGDGDGACQGAPAELSFSELTSQYLASCVTKQPLSFPSAAHRREHYGVLSVRPRHHPCGRETTASQPTTTSSSSSAHTQLLVFPLAQRITTLATDTLAATLCFIAECTRLAETCRRTAVARWHHTIHARTRKALQLPAKAALLHDALVEEVAQPDPAELLAYYASLPRERLGRAVAMLETTLASIGVDTLRITQACQQAALEAAQRQPPPSATTASSFSPSSSPLSSCSAASLSSVAAAHAQAPHPDWAALGVALANQQRESEAWLARVKVEAQMEAQLVQWVLQRASLTLALEGVEATAEDGASASMPLPLPVTRHPGLLRALVCIQQGKSTAWETRTGPTQAGTDTTTTTPALLRRAENEEEGAGTAGERGVMSAAAASMQAKAAVAPSSSSQSRTRSRGAMEAAASQSQNNSAPTSPNGASSAASVQSRRATNGYSDVEMLVQCLWAGQLGREECARAPVPLEPVWGDGGVTTGASSTAQPLLIDLLPAGCAGVEGSDTNEAEKGEDEDEVRGGGGDHVSSLPAILILHATRSGEEANSSLVLRRQHVVLQPPHASLSACYSGDDVQDTAVHIEEACVGEGSPITPSSLGTLTSFVALSSSRYLLLFSSPTKGGSVAGSITAVIVQDDGHIEMIQPNDEDCEEEEEEEDGEAVSAQHDEEAFPCGGEKPAVLSVPGIEAPLHAAVSRSREFGVVAALDKFVVIDLYAE